MKFNSKYKKMFILMKEICVKSFFQFADGGPNTFMANLKFPLLLQQLQTSQKWKQTENLGTVLFC